MDVRAVLTWIVFCGVLSGCANLRTVHRNLNLGNESDAKAVAIDGYQQPIFAHRVRLNDKDMLDETGNRIAFVVCPNPPVEAITAGSIAAALGNGFNAGRALGIGAANLSPAALASAMSAASIGLRTNSTTLLSYNATANCLAYMGGATHDRRFMELARRNQHITLGILAIEQLTGIAQAGQASLNTTSAGGTGTDDLAPLQTNLDNARKDANTAKANEAAALALRDRALKERDAKANARQLANDKLAKLKPEKTEAYSAAAKELNDAELAEATAAEAYQDAAMKAAAAGREVSRTEDMVEHARVAIDLAERAVRTIATGAGQAGQGGGPRGSATAAVAGAVVDIMKVVTSGIIEGETCAAILDDFRLATVAQMPKWDGPAGRQILADCAAERRASAIARLPSNVPLDAITRELDVESAAIEQILTSIAGSEAGIDVKKYHALIDRAKVGSSIAAHLKTLTTADAIRDYLSRTFTISGQPLYDALNAPPGALK